MTDTWQFFGDSPEAVARQIQERVRRETGIYLAVGIGDSPVLAKLALDNEAKKARNLMATWHFEDVQTKLWPITNLNAIWSIGKRTAQKLNNMGINSMYDLAHQDPYVFRSKMGLMGEQLYALAWGIDRSDLTEKVVPKSKSYSNCSEVNKLDYFYSVN